MLVFKLECSDVVYQCQPTGIQTG